MMKKEKIKFEKFMKFVEWYMKCGGHPLTSEQIERTMLKFDCE